MIKIIIFNLVLLYLLYRIFRQLINQLIDPQQSKDNQVHVSKWYEVLNVDPNCTDEELRVAYKELVKKYHPDKVLNKNAPDDFIEFVNKRFNQIQQSYEMVCRQRGIK